jgi:DNA-binding transcriptional LysR family regulator
VSALRGKSCARRVLEEAAAATDDARRAARGQTGRLRIGFMASALLEFLPAVLRHFHANHPEVQLHLEEMSSSRSGRAVIDGICDVSLTRGAPRGAGAELPRARRPRCAPEGPPAGRPAP